ncbi:MAG: methyltransferase domain-containing protein [Trueperaceae bacterium]|nr:methyltransferase domain-containing protein [Trueperaceae bacterium]
MTPSHATDAAHEVPYEAEVLPGLAPFAREELRLTGRARLGPKAPGTDRAGTDQADAVRFTWPGGHDVPTERLRTVTALHRVLAFDVPRPKALLGDAHLRRIVDAMRMIVRASDSPFHAVRLEAAGKDSPVMRRLRAALAQGVELPDDPEEGDLQVRVRPSVRPGPAGASGAGWEVLIRTTPRPLSVRDWRVRNLPGGLNACVAAAAWRWIGHAKGQRVLNAMCGSGTLLAERAALGPAARLAGVDLDPDALEASEANLRAAGLRVRSDLSGGPADAQVELRLADAAATPFEDASFDVVVADPPWGDAMGEVADLHLSYGAFLREAARLLPVGGSALVVTHALRAFDAALADEQGSWRAEGVMRVFHGGHRPAMHHLIRR